MDSQLLQSSTSVEGASYAYATVSSSPPKKRAGRTKFRETRHPVYRGVRRRGSNGERWVCEMREPSKKSRIWLGTFPTAEMAARAHDVAAMALQGRKACLNFADSAWRLVVPNSACHKDIQQAAAVAAQMFRPSAGVADQEEQSSSPARPLSPSPSASSVTELVAVESSSVFDLAGFDFGELQEQSYYGLQLGAVRGGWDYDQWDDLECSVADVSLWSFSY